MKLLLYAEPSFCFDLVHSTRPDINASDFFGIIASTLVNDTQTSIRSIVPGQFQYLNDIHHSLDIFNPIPVSFNELRSVFTNATSLLSIYKCIYNESYSDNESQNFRQLIINKLDDNWAPDIVITYPIHNSILKQIFPEALHLQMENGILSRFPFPSSIKFDPFHYANEFVRRFRNEIQHLNVSEHDRALIQNLAQDLRALIQPSDSARHSLTDLRKTYKHILLLPVLASNCYNESSCDDQLSFINAIMARVPMNTAVVATFHDTVDAQINSTTFQYLRSIYPNLYNFQSNKADNYSAVFFPYVDAVVNCSTMTGMQAKLFGVRVVAIDKRYSHGFADKIGLDGLSEWLSEPAPDTTPELVWLLTHGNIFDRRYNEDGWNFKYLNTLLDQFRAKGITPHLFPKIEDLDGIVKYIVNKTKANIRINKMRSFVPDFILYILFKAKTAILNAKRKNRRSNT